MSDKHLMKLRARDEVSAEEERAIRAAASEPFDYPPDTTFITAGQPLENSTLLLQGIMCRYKDLSQGQRQITQIHVAGDFADLHSFTLGHLDHNLMTLTPCRVATVAHERLRDITERFPHLTRVYWFNTSLDACLHREWELSLGRRTAIQRAAHLFCELQVRLGIVGLADTRSYQFPVTQGILAECLGLTSVHVNRVLKELRERKLLDFRSGRVTIHDMQGLKRIAEFDPAYLYLDKRSR